MMTMQDTQQQHTGDITPASTTDIFPSPGIQQESPSALLTSSSLAPYFPSSASHHLFPAGGDIKIDNPNFEDSDSVDAEDDHDDDGDDDDNNGDAASSTPSSTPVITQEDNNGNNKSNNDNVTNDSSNKTDRNGPNDSQTPDTTDDDLNELIANPWTPSMKQDFYKKFNFNNPAYKNKLRLYPHAEQRVRYFLLNPDAPLDPSLSSDARLKLRAKGYTLQPLLPNGTLYRNESTIASTTLRQHVSEANVWNILTSEHVKSGHKGRDRMLSLIKDRFVGYTLEELMFVLGTCRLCARARMSGSGGMSLGSRGSQNQNQQVLKPGRKQKSQLPQLTQSSAQMQQSPSPSLLGPQLTPLAPRPESQQEHLLQEQAIQEQGLRKQKVRILPAPKHSRFGTRIEGIRGPQQSAPGHAPTTVTPFTQPLPQQHPLPQLPQQQQQSSPLGIGAVRRGLFAPNELGLVAYDVPDWYS